MKDAQQDCSCRDKPDQSSKSPETGKKERSLNNKDREMRLGFFSLLLPTREKSDFF
jgi:hypothetical protein